jgi:Mg/Co/Ni transporter MgtE
MTNDQIKVAELFFRMIVQSILVLATTSIWLGVTVALIWNPQWPIVAIESLLSLTLGYIFSYFFGVLGPRRRR